MDFHGVLTYNHSYLEWPEGLAWHRMTGQDSSFAAFLSDGEVVVEASARAWLQKPDFPSISHPFPIHFSSVNLGEMGMSENGAYPQWNSHLVGIMISKTIGYNGVHYFQTNPNLYPKDIQGLAACQAAQRAVRREEVPFVEFRFTMNPEAHGGAGTVANVGHVEAEVEAKVEAELWRTFWSSVLLELI